MQARPELQARVKLAIFQELKRRELGRENYDWTKKARPNQLPPSDEDWATWLLLAGRGFGKTRTGAEWIRSGAESGKVARIALVGATAADVRDVMIEGESGLLAVAPSWNRPSYEPSKRRVVWKNGAIATAYSADEPDRLRGPQHARAWCDELAAWRYLQDAWDMLQMGLRLGSNPQTIVTTTPRPLKLIKELLADPTTRLTTGSTFDNSANLAAKYLKKVQDKYEGTRLGRQEIYAEILDDNPRALWTLKRIEELRVKTCPALRRFVVSIDPAVTSNPDSDETGIIAGGLGFDGHAYVTDDLSLIATPDTWAKAAVKVYQDKKGDRIIGEVNNGGDLVETVLRHVDSTIPFKKIVASKGKTVRAEPVSALYEQGKVHHVGAFRKLEDQMCEFDGSPDQDSPDRMDALVYLITELMGINSGGIIDFYRDSVRGEAEAEDKKRAAMPSAGPAAFTQR